ncbi:hypothetical protein M0811_13455 [Anaeramoeba ignava]|uniref:Proteasome activator complex subunit 3 n=1 Tax=Anaeramoeba ignava TaxID=1746090 RepID=A0A9Q0L727_ANAIG|nr:hypothetical protein M0811_13455 [Anaeramoeba ignava]
MTDPKVDKEIQNYKDTIIQKANQIIHKIIPNKILELEKKNQEIQKNQILKKKQETSHHVQIIQNEKTEQKIKKPKSNTKTTLKKEEEEKKELDFEVPCNKDVSLLIHDIKKEVLELVDYSKTIQLWIQFLTPKVSDGNNFGVEIQQEILEEFSRAEDSCFVVLDSIGKYFISRAKLISNWLKHKDISDFERGIVELDLSQILSCEMIFKDLQNDYSILYDIVIKNLEKIENPRPERSVTMY